ncbi:MAG: hypothetical protein FJ126_14250 [Deltaproteobacteria bacterium]|nr:hypothetical protein [Deltaproteobacteria bacterium]
MNDPTPIPEAAAANLILVGAVHGDPQGYSRVWKLLGFLRPHLISVEISPFSLRYRRRWEKDWLKKLDQALTGLPQSAQDHLALKRLAAQVALPFEARAARDWSRAHKTPWRALDLGELSRRHLPRYGRELLNRENLESLLATADGSMKDWVAGEFHRARKAWKQRPARLPGSGYREALQRERFLARRLRRLSAQGRVVHLGGWEHLVAWQDGQGLVPWLIDLHPARILLEDADLLSDSAFS